MSNYRREVEDIEQLPREHQEPALDGVLRKVATHWNRTQERITKYREEALALEQILREIEAKRDRLQALEEREVMGYE